MKKGYHYRLSSSSNSDPVAIRTNLQQEQLKKAPQLMLGALHKICGDST